MFHVKLSGTPQEMGQQHGAMLKHAGVQLPVLNPKLNEIAKECEIVLKELAPEYHAEVTALAQSANLNPETVLGLLLAAPLEHTIPSCSVIAFTADRSASGEIIVGRNYDWLFNPAKYTSSTYDTQPSEGYAHMVTVIGGLVVKMDSMKRDYLLRCLQRSYRVYKLVYPSGLLCGCS